MTKLKFALAALALAHAGGAFAVDATLTFTGDIIIPTCTLDTNTANQTITLTTAGMQDMIAVGSVSHPKAFNLVLTNCTPTVVVTMTLGGTADSSVSSVLKNTGTAAGLGIQVLKAAKSGDTTGTPIPLNQGFALGMVDSTNSMTIPLVGQYYRLGAMAAGSVSAVATVNFSYN